MCPSSSSIQENTGPNCSIEASDNFSATSDHLRPLWRHQRHILATTIFQVNFDKLNGPAKIQAPFVLASCTIRWVRSNSAWSRQRTVIRAHCRYWGDWSDIGETLSSTFSGIATDNRICALAAAVAAAGASKLT